VFASHRPASTCCGPQPLGGRLQVHEQAEAERRVADFPGELVRCRAGHSDPDPQIIPWPGDPNTLEPISAVPPSFNPTVMNPLEGRPVVRSLGQLRLHPALDAIGWTSAMHELNEAARLKSQSVPEPILITTDGTILAGFGPWRLAAFEGRREIHCIEYPFSSEDESLQFIIRHHQLQRGWNAFIRICLALKLEPYFQLGALKNMRAGGKYKGSANLPEAEHIDVRQEIGNIAGVGARNVSNVRTILHTAHPRLIEALRDGMLTINRAIQFCKLPKKKQLEEFIRYSEERSINRAIRRSIPQPKEKKASVDVLAVLDALQRQEARRPGSVAVRVSRDKRTVVLVGQDYIAGSHSQKELGLT
jgi:hypothetical protein